jgi:hypothetical protein
MSIDWLRDWETAVTAARAARKPIVLDVYQDS